MVNYAKGKIYKIVNDITHDIYIGSTCEDLCERMAKHRYKCKILIERKLYAVMREIGIQHFKIILIESFSCHNNNELRAREQYHIDLNKPILNSYNAVINMEDRKVQKAEYYSEWSKSEINKQKRYNAIHRWGLVQVECKYCDKKMNRSSSFKHRTTKAHESNVLKYITNWLKARKKINSHL